MPPPQRKPLLLPFQRLIGLTLLELERLVPPLTSPRPAPAVFAVNVRKAEQLVKYAPLHEPDSVVFQRTDYFAPLFSLLGQLAVPPDLAGQARQFVYRVVGSQMTDLAFPNCTLFPTDAPQ